MQEQISGLISKASELHEQLEQERAAASAHLDRLAAISAGVERAKQQPLPQLPEVCAPCLASQRSQGQAQHMSDDTFRASTLQLQISSASGSMRIQSVPKFDGRQVLMQKLRTAQYVT